MSELLRNFKSEAFELIDSMIKGLEACEGADNPSQGLSTFAQLSDRIMGAAKQLKLDGVAGAGRVADLAALLKILGYKTSRVEGYSSLLTVAIGVLMDATMELKQMTVALGEMAGEDNEEGVSEFLIGRLQWLDVQIGPDAHGGVPSSAQIEGEFEDLVKRVTGKK